MSDVEDVPGHLKTDKDLLFTTRQLAKRWSLHKDTPARWRVEGKGPAFFKQGKGKNAGIRYHLRDVLEYEVENNLRSTSTRETYGGKKGAKKG